MRYASLKDAAGKLGLNSGRIGKVCAGKRKQTGGYQFRFVAPTEG